MEPKELNVPVEKFSAKYVFLLIKFILIFFKRME